MSIPCGMDEKTEARAGMNELPTVTQKVHQDWPSPRSSDLQPAAPSNQHTASQQPCPHPGLFIVDSGIPSSSTLN